jgi:hypothetical protein
MTDLTTGDAHGGHGDHGELHLQVFSPREPDPRPFEFPRPEHVADAAQAAALVFGYQPGTWTFQTRDGTVLPRDISLAAAHVHDGDTLELVDAGGGV